MHAKASAWLGFGEPHGDFRRPVCVREDPFQKGSQQYAKFREAVSFFNPSGYISEITRLNVYTIPENGDDVPATDETKTPDSFAAAQALSQPESWDKCWVKEVGICTLHELFGKGIVCRC
jgi:hypothetical protein